MPRYEYECPYGHRKEHTFDFGKAPKKVLCKEPPEGDPNGLCGIPATRVISSVAFSFKGGAPSAS